LKGIFLKKFEKSHLQKLGAKDRKDLQNETILNLDSFKFLSITLDLGWKILLNYPSL